MPWRRPQSTMAATDLGWTNRDPGMTTRGGDGLHSPSPKIVRFLSQKSVLLLTKRVSTHSDVRRRDPTPTVHPSRIWSEGGAPAQPRPPWLETRDTGAQCAPPPSFLVREGCLTPDHALPRSKRETEGLMHPSAIILSKAGAHQPLPRSKRETDAQHTPSPLLRAGQARLIHHHPLPGSKRETEGLNAPSAIVSSGAGVPDT